MLIFMTQNTVSRRHLHLKWPILHWNSNMNFSSHFNIMLSVFLVTQGVQTSAWGKGTYH